MWSVYNLDLSSFGPKLCKTVVYKLFIKVIPRIVPIGWSVLFLFRISRVCFKTYEIPFKQYSKILCTGNYKPYVLYSQCAAIGLSSILILVMAQNSVWSSYKFYKAKLMVSPLWDYNNQITMTDRGVKQYVII